MKKLALVSLCLLGVDCRYNGKNKKMKHLDKLLEKYVPIPFCPEQVGGLPTPRPASFFIDGDGEAVLKGEARIVNEKGEDVTSYFLKGCQEAVKLIRLLNIDTVILKDRSPACGVEYIWIGDSCVEGKGVLKAILERLNFKVEIINGDRF